MSAKMKPLPEVDLVRHVESCAGCVIVGCTPRTLCPRGVRLWDRWVAKVRRLGRTA